MQEPIAATPPLQPISARNSRQRLTIGFPRRRRAKNHMGLTATQWSTYSTVKRLVRTSRDYVCNWSVPRLADACGISVTQFQRDMQVIVTRGLILRCFRTGTDYRNDTNLWMLPPLAGGGDGRINATQKKEIVSTKTTTRPAYSRSQENHPPEVRERVEHNARARHHRMQRSNQHRPDAFLGHGVRPDGYYSGQLPLSAEEEALRAKLNAAARGKN